MTPEPTNRFVGKNKTKAAQAEQTRSRGTKPKQERTQNDEIVTQLKEFQEWANPNFNVLVVQTPRPWFFDSPLLAGFRSTLKETQELLKSIMRFGLPVTSVRNKLPYWRDDQAPLPSTPSVRLQRALQAADHVSMGVQRHHPHRNADGSLPLLSGGNDEHAAGATMPSTGMHPMMALSGMFHKHGHGSSAGHGQRFLFSEETSLIFTAALNLALWWVIGSPPRSRPLKA